MSHVDEGLVHAYLDGELTPVERARVDEHLAGCAACRTRRDEERQLIERASKLLGLATPADRPGPPLTALARRRPWWHISMPLAWAATIVLAVGVTWTVAVQMMPRHAPETLGGPVALREQPQAQAQPAAPPATATGRLEPRQMPKPVRKAVRQDTAAADQLANNQPAVAEEKSGAGVVAAAPSVAAPLPRADVRIQAVTVGPAPENLDAAAARTMLGREPLVIPGLVVRRITRSPRAADEIMIEQALDSTQVIVLYERRPAAAYAQRDEAATLSRARAPAVAKAATDSATTTRVVNGVLIEIQARVTADSLSKLLARVQ